MSKVALWVLPLVPFVVNNWSWFDLFQRVINPWIKNG